MIELFKDRYKLSLVLAGFFFLAVLITAFYQAAANGKTLYVDDIPEGYIYVISGLGSASPKYLLIVPFKKQEQVIGMLEIASF